MIVIILASQTFASVVGTGRLTWPIISYPMYARAHFEGDRLDHGHAAYAVLADGSRIPIDPAELDMSFWTFQSTVVKPVRLGNLDRLAPILARYCTQHDAQIVRVEIDDLGVAIGHDGVVTGLPPETMYAADVTC